VANRGRTGDNVRVSHEPLGGPIAREEAAMAIELNHTIVPAQDPVASAAFLASVLGLTVGAPVSHFTPLTLDNGVTLDYDTADEVNAHHYAFLVSDAEFEAAFGRIRDSGIEYYADPGCRRVGEVYSGKNGSTGTYFRDPNGHLMEILTAGSTARA
jgi:catechol 2,3-dioxygenase-like lactoylglutathione lyase family enzyme